MKYELTNERLEAFGSVLYRIKALRSFNNVNAGDLGGFVENTGNLSQAESDNAWIFGNAWVYGNAAVSGNARVYSNAQVYGNAAVSGDAQVFGSARVSGDALVYGTAQVFGNAWVHGNAQVSGDAQVFGSARVEIGLHTGTQGSAPSTNAVVNSNISDFAKIVSDFSKSIKMG